jgi:hypothetical protein
VVPQLLMHKVVVEAIQESFFTVATQPRGFVVFAAPMFICSTFYRH